MSVAEATGEDLVLEAHPQNKQMHVETWLALAALSLLGALYLSYILDPSYQGL